MTYNFDPDRWFDNEYTALEGLLKQGELSRNAYETALEDLERRYDEMLERLDGTYRLPEEKRVN
jgi:hypothetical protein